MCEHANGGRSGGKPWREVPSEGEVELKRRDGGCEREGREGKERESRDQKRTRKIKLETRDNEGKGGGERAREGGREQAWKERGMRN